MLNLPFIRKSNHNLKPVVLIIMDGFGVAPASKGNAITEAKTPNYKRLLSLYPHSELIASGESVGLPANEVGNTEVGHLTIGAGRVILQDLKRINVSIENGRFYDNRIFLKAASWLRQNNSKLHLLGLIGSGNVHSSYEHLIALLQFCKKEEIGNVYLHLFTDGRDSPPKQGIEMVEKLESYMKGIKLGSIASIMGRYFAMDRDRRWDRTEKAYDALVSGQGQRGSSAKQILEESYAKGTTDEFIEPSVVVGANNQPITIDDNDAVIFFNFRIDRPKQLTMAFVLPDFENLKEFDFGYDPETSREEGKVNVGKTFKRQKVPKNLFFVTMTEYQKELPVSGVAFGPELVEKPFNIILSEAGLKQMHMAESEKERFVTYYFDGLREKPVDGEEFHIVPSPKVATYDLKPEMSLPKLIRDFKRELNRNKYGFFVLNFANPDMVAHTGNMQATVEAIGYVDKYLGELVSAVMSKEGTVFITADHGNAEELLTFPTKTFFYTTSQGTVNTDHSNNPVPLIIVNKSLEGKHYAMDTGALSDIAPTILHYMGLRKPDEMTGKNLFTIDQSVVSNNLTPVNNKPNQQS